MSHILRVINWKFALLCGCVVISSRNHSKHERELIEKLLFKKFQFLSHQCGSCRLVIDVNSLGNLAILYWAFIRFWYTKTVLPWLKDSSCNWKRIALIGMMTDQVRMLLIKKKNSRLLENAFSQSDQFCEYLSWGKKDLKMMFGDVLDRKGTFLDP